MYLPGSNVKSLYCDPVEHVFTEVYPDFILKKSQFLFVVQMLFLFFFNFVQQLQANMSSLPQLGISILCCLLLYIWKKRNHAH